MNMSQVEYELGLKQEARLLKANIVFINKLLTRDSQSRIVSIEHETRKHIYRETLDTLAHRLRVIETYFELHYGTSAMLTIARQET